VTTVTSAGTTQCYEYDARGQQTAGADGRAVAYTEYGLPTQITRDGVQWQFGYDATHRRARKTGPAGSTIYVGSLYEKRVATDGTESHVMYVLAGGDVKAQIVVDGASGDPQIDYLMRDHLGSVTKAGGNGVWPDMRFDPYGGRIATTPPPTPISESPSSRVRLGFTGQEEDDDLGLVNMNGRIYDPAIARFLTPDPLVSMHSPSQSWNRYSYAENSPLRFVDPSGFDPQDGSGGNGPPPGVHMECTSAFNCGYMTSSGVYLTQDNWNYWSGNYSTSPAGPNVGSFDEAGAGASAGITYGMVVASKDGQSQGDGGQGGADEEVREFGASARDSIARENYESAIANMQAAGELGGQALGMNGEPIRMADSIWFSYEGRTVYWLTDSGSVDETFSARSGPFGNGHLEPGDYVASNLRDTNQKGMVCPNEPTGWKANLDPEFQTSRTDLRFHPDGPPLGTQGCIGLSCADAQRFYDRLASYLNANGSIRVQVSPY
jgi:RHS repeat-associated protein